MAGYFSSHSHYDIQYDSPLCPQHCLFFILNYLLYNKMGAGQSNNLK